MVLSSVLSISNIGLLTAETLTSEPNYKEPTFSKEPSPDNDEVETILIGDLCAFDKTMVYRRGPIGNRRKYTLIPDHHSSSEKNSKQFE